MAKTATKTAAVFTSKVINGTKYTSTVHRGTRYTLQRLGGQWFVSTHRLALGRFSTGGGRYYATWDALQAGCKAFASLDMTAAL